MDRDRPLLRGDFNDVAFFVCRFPVFIGLARFQLNGFVASGADWEFHSGSVMRNGAHGAASTLETYLV